MGGINKWFSTKQKFACLIGFNAPRLYAVDLLYVLQKVDSTVLHNSLVLTVLWTHFAFPGSFSLLWGIGTGYTNNSASHTFGWLWYYCSQLHNWWQLSGTDSHFILIVLLTANKLRKDKTCQAQKTLKPLWNFLWQCSKKYSIQLFSCLSKSSYVFKSGIR